TRVSNTDDVIPTITQDISYTAFDQPAEVTEGNFELDYDYGFKYQRIKSVLKENGAVTTTRLYMGDFERQTKQGVTKDIHYVNAGQGTVAMIVKDNGVYDFYYTYTDHLGSILTVTDDSGTIVAEQNFDAWGRKRNASTWTYDNVGSVPDWLYRGYTGHEEMQEFGLINMNGRLYDPVVGRMLSGDNQVHTSVSTQGYNRYSYVFNNPLSYTDPNGEIPLAIPIVVGAAVAGAYAGASIASGGQWNFTKWSKGKWWKGAIVGAFIGAAIGSAVAVNITISGVSTVVKGERVLTTGWKIATSMIKGANIKMGVTALTGGGLDKMYKAALIGAALGGFKAAYKVTKGYGLLKLGKGWKLVVPNFQKAAYIFAESIGANWINGDPLLYNYVIGVGPLRFTFGKKHDKVFRILDNIGSLLPEAIKLSNWVNGEIDGSNNGSLGFDWSTLTLTTSGGWLATLPELGLIERSVAWNANDWLSFIGQYFSKLKSS
ncbi:MAG: RHS repeat-associated core domain-containing protein, partial [Bacteroidota bacterium]